VRGNIPEDKSVHEVPLDKLLQIASYFRLNEIEHELEEANKKQEQFNSKQE
jgi:hypothetical protein